MSQPCILAYDLGTTGNKATLFRDTGTIVASEFRPYDTLYPQPGWAEQRPADWWDSLVGATRELLTSSGVSPSHVVAIGLSGHMMGCLPVTDKGDPLTNAIIHSDVRSASECEIIEREVGGQAVYGRTGQRVDPHYPLTKAMWLQRNEPDLLARTRFLIQCKDYLVFRLTGRLGVTDFSDATLTGLYDINAMGWSDELIAAAQLDGRLLPEVVASATIVGPLSAEAARVTGLKQGTPVVAGAGDGACATLGAGVAEPGSAYNYVGGTAWIAAMVAEPDIDPAMRLFTLGCAEYGRMCAIGTIQSAGSSLEWVADEVCHAEKELAVRQGVHHYEAMDEAARQSMPGAKGLYFLPYMMGERAPIWDPAARGTFLGLTLGHRRADLIRATLEGVAYALRSVLDVLEERKIDVGSLRIIGGGAKSSLWLEIMAAVYGRTLQVPEYPGESTSLGAALIAGVGAGLYPDYPAAVQHIAVKNVAIPAADWVAEYARRYPFFKTLYPTLRETFARLAALGER